jgi:hypothetical protein
MADTDATTQAVIDAIKAEAPADAEVTGSYDAEVNAWTWLLTVPDPTEENPENAHSISRQFVPTDEMPMPSETYVAGLVTEMVTTAALSITPPADPAAAPTGGNA